MNRLSRLSPIRASVAVAFAVALGAFGVIHGPASAPVAAQSQSVAEPIPVLPTIIVSARTEMPILPVVAVRPSAEELLAAGEGRDDGESLVASSAGSDSITDLLPRARLDMPYYSFGKTLPRASKD